MSHTIESLKPKHAHAVAALFSGLEMVPEGPIANRESFATRSSALMHEVLEPALMKYARIVDSLVYGNSFIGSDYFILRYVSYTMLLYWQVLSKERLTKEDADSCELQIETQFYFYLNMVYNLKEKFEKLAAYQDGRVGTLVLTGQATDTLCSLYRATYPAIQELCEARGHVVHDVYRITLLREDSKVLIGSSPFDLLPLAEHEVPSYRTTFDLADDAIMRPVAALYSLTEQVVGLLRDLSNVDPEKLEAKFIRRSPDGKTISIGI